jgi:hypothetical protein
MHLFRALPITIARLFLFDALAISARCLRQSAYPGLLR